MQKENNLTAGQWCDHWFTANRHKWNSNTEGGYRNLIYSHIIPSIGGVVLSGLTKQTIINFYDSLRSQGLGARSVWCVHLLLRRCMDEAAQDQLIPYNPVRLCQEPKAEEYKTAPLRLGQLQRYLNAAEQLGVLPLIYTGLLRRCRPAGRSLYLSAVRRDDAPEGAEQTAPGLPPVQYPNRDDPQASPERKNLR